MAATKSTCGGCSEIFASVAAFDSHRVGSFGEPIYQTSRTGRSRSVAGHSLSSRRCLTRHEMHCLGMVQNEKGWWMLPPTANLPHEEGSELFAR
jgi:hypothetical protein